MLCHSAIVEVAPIRYPSATELLRMKLGFGYFKFPGDPSRNIFHLAGPSVCGSHGAAVVRILRFERASRVGHLCGYDVKVTT